MTQPKLQSIPSPEKLHRVILNTDAKNEADDQFAIVHALLTTSFEIHSIIPAHFGPGTSPGEDTRQASWDEVNLLLRLMSLKDKVRVDPGAGRALPNEATPQPSPGAELIVSEAMKDDPRPLNVLFFGPLTDMASAILMEPRIRERNLHIIWVGGAEGLTHYGKEFNLSNDVHAANVVMRSPIPVSQIPYPLYGHFCVGHEELLAKVFPHGPLGRYLVEQLIEHSRRVNTMANEYHSLGDSPAVGVLIAPHSGRWQMRAAPIYDPETCDVSQRLENVRPVREYETFDARFLLEDFFAKIARFADRTSKPID
ncbi:MAG: nucleoside hydrolase [Chthoniobacterales bacterium]